jgi:HlyD family secretion protein
VAQRAENRLETAAEPVGEPSGESAVSSASALVRRQRVFLWVTGGAAVLAVGGLIAGTLVKSPAQLAASQGPPKASYLTATVQDEVLSQQVVTRGNVVAGGSLTATPTAEQGASALVITGTPVAAGSAISPGEVIAQVSDRPLIALPGALPAFRDLKPGDSGSDITELQAALKTLGYADSDTSGVFGAGTKSAVQAMYRHLGYDPATTGGYQDQSDQSTLLADAQAVTQAQRTVTTDEQALTQAQGAIPPVPSVVTAARQTLTYAQQDLHSAQTADDQEIADTGVDLPMNEFLFVPSFPATLAAVNGTVGATVAAPLVTLDTGALEITGTLDQSDAQSVKSGMSVQIFSEILNQGFTATLSSVGPYSGGGGGSGTVPSGGSPSSGGAADAGANPPAGQGGAQSATGYPFTISPGSGLSTTAWLGQNVRVTVTGASSPGKVLVVPVAAITSNANGTTSVQVLQAGNSEKQVQVTVGITADGNCQVTPAVPGALSAGANVVVGQ